MQLVSLDEFGIPDQHRFSFVTCVSAALKIDLLSAELFLQRSPLFKLEATNLHLSINHKWLLLDGKLLDISNGTVLETGYLGEAGKSISCLSASLIIEIPTVVPRANFIRILGVGTYGIAELYNTESHGKIVVKRLKHLSQTEQQTMAKGEIQNLRRISSPHVIKITAVIYRNLEGEPIDSFAIEYAPRGNLFEVLKNNALNSESEKIILARGIVRGLAAVHNVHVALRDLKSGNILLDDNMTPKLSDFGLSKHLPNCERTYTVCGSQGYMAPEILTGTGYSYSCDIWSLGCVLLELFLGLAKIPMDAQTGAWIGAISNDQLAARSTSRASLVSSAFPSSDGIDLITALLQDDANKRPNAYSVLHHPFLS